MKIRKRRTPKILIAPNKALNTVCVPVVNFQSYQIKPVIRDMLYCLNKRKYGVGLAANQIGSNLRIIIVQHTMESFKEYPAVIKYIVMINPVITQNGGSSSIGYEDCLSYPGRTKRIKRYNWIKLTWANEYGEECNSSFTKISARIIQHECDHLNGQCKVGL